MTTDHYDVLGVTPDARHTDIRAAYRSLIREHHPDVRPGDPGAEEMSRRITAAWSVLGRPTARAAYDRVRSAARQQGPAVAARPRPEGPAAYSSGHTDYRRAFHLASVRLAAVVFALGVLVLLAFSR